MVFRKNYRRRKGNSTARLLIWLAVLIALGFVIRFAFLRDKVSADVVQKATSTPSTIASTTGNLANWPKLRDRIGTFEVSYPRRVFKLTEKSVPVPPDGNDKAKAQILSHTIPFKHCSVSGECNASTTDMSVSFFTVERSFNDIFKELEKRYNHLPVVTIDGHQGVTFKQGTEGEGSIYTILPVSDSRTIFIGRHYIDEEKSKDYQNAKGFIKYSDQKAIFEQILSTFNFRPSF